MPTKSDISISSCWMIDNKIKNIIKLCVVAFEAQLYFYEP